MKIQRIIGTALLITISFLEWYLLELSCGLNEKIFAIQIKYILLNVCLLISINFVVLLLTNKLCITYIISTVFFSTLGIINYFVILYHASPFTIGEIRNLKTALEVVDAYSFDFRLLPFRMHVTIIILITLCVGSFLLRNKLSFTRKRGKGKYFLLAVCVGYCLLGFMGNSIKPQKTIGWDWKEAYGKYGYLSCLLEDAFSRFNTIHMPENYDSNDVQKIYTEYAENENKGSHYPDIIFIVNESFFDLRAIADFETDKDYFENIDKMKLIKGYAVCPTPGGGTNSSEYELLSSNSLYLMRAGIVPFNVLDLRNSASIVSYLKSLGYSTLGTHIGAASNYNRKKGYNDIGFDEVKFDVDYEDVEYLGRWFASDMSAYQNIEKWYEEMPEVPRFIYCLTIQNHGDWEQTLPDYDTIHLTDNSFDNKSIIEEYLTCLSLSDEAFKNLTSYYEKCERDVIICMVGDHSPRFAKDLIYDSADDQTKICLRGTPVYIWANFEGKRWIACT